MRTKTTTRWPSISLGDHVDLLAGFPFKSAGYVQDEDGIRLLRGDNVVQGRFRWIGVKRWPRSAVSGLERYFLEAGDVILAMDRPWIDVGLKYAWVKKSDLPCLLVQRVARLRGRAGLTTEYLRYVIGSRSFSDYIRPIVTGVNVPHISPTQIGSFRFQLPPVPIQRKLGAILAAYDDLIENNTRRIKILDEMAEVIYREWFVEFRVPGVRLRTATREERKVTGRSHFPVDWEIGKLSEAVLLQRGFDLPVQERREGPVPVYAATGVVGTHNEAPVKGPGVVTGRSGSLGTVLYVEEDFWPLNTTLWVKEFRNSTPLWAFYVLSGLGLDNFNSGAAVPTLNRNDIHGVPIVLPPRDVMERFGKVVEPMIKLKSVLLRRSENARGTRDMLLPRLISGGVSVEKLEIATADGHVREVAELSK